MEKYYYTTTNENGNKHKNYVDRTDPKLSMNLDEELQYNKGTDTAPDIVSIETEWEAPSGLKLVTKRADIKGANLVDTEPDELLQLREQHKNLKLNITSLSSSIYSNKQQLIALALSRKAIKIQLKMNDFNLKSSDEELALMQNVKQDRRTVVYSIISILFACLSPKNFELIHISTISFASSSPTIRSPRHNMLLLLCSLDILAEQVSDTTAALIPLTLLAVMDIPIPVPQTSMPFS